MGTAATIVILAIIVYSYYREQSLIGQIHDTKDQMKEEFLSQRREMSESHQKEIKKLKETIDDLKNSNATKELREQIISDYSNELRIISDSAYRQGILDEIPTLELAFCENFYHHWHYTHQSNIVESPELDTAVWEYYIEDYANYHFDEISEMLELE